MLLILSGNTDFPIFPVTENFSARGLIVICVGVNFETNFDNFFYTK